MRGAPQRPNGESPDAFAAGFDEPPIGGSRIRAAAAFFGFLFDERARGPAAYLFVACKAVA